MENASKALLMAASVLIGLLVISLAVYLFVSFGSTSAEMHKQNAEQQISQFNSQFTSYEEKTCTIYDVVSVASLAKENNQYYELTEPANNSNYISVTLNGRHIENSETKEYDDIIGGDVATINSDNGSLPQYRCQVQINPITERVYIVNFNKKQK